jgi:predicted RNA-binding Zn-ribbon protein involved in translation (DUF1610 family)
MTSNLTSVELVVIPLVVILAIVVIGLLLYLMRRLRRKRDKLLNELKDAPELIQDRAFNRIAMARREAEILSRTGADVAAARTLIAQAQGAFDTRNYDRAYESAQSAHEALVNARRAGGTGLLPTPPRAVPPTSPEPVAAPLASGATTSPPPRTTNAPPIPKNRVESQFQLRVLGEEIESARSSHRPGSKVQTAETMRQQAQAAFTSGEYTEAFRLALRGRRELGGALETLPAAGHVSGASGESLGEPSGPLDVGAVAERTASANRCPDCGNPMLADDAFCRGCGRPRADLKCPQCGASRGPKDTFCGRCGERYA